MQNGDLIVGVNRPGQEQNLLGLTLFDKAPVQVTLHRTMNTKKGVIRCPALRDIEVEEIVEGLRNEGVTEARKIFFNRDGNRVPSATVILTFACSTLPKEIKAGYLNVKVDPYIPNPLRCFQCNRFGHPKDQCRRNATCGRCGSLEHTDDRQCQLTPHCVNCEGEHSSFSKDCPRWKEEKEIQRIKITQNISFQQARQQVMPTPAPGRLFTDMVKKRVTTCEVGVQVELENTQEIIISPTQPSKNNEQTKPSTPSNSQFKDISGNYQTLSKTQRKKLNKKQRNLEGTSCEEALRANEEAMDFHLPPSPPKEKQSDRRPRSPIKAPT